MPPTASAADPDNAFRERQAVGGLLCLRVEASRRGTSRAVDEAKQRIPRVRLKAIPCILRAQRPSVLRLVTGKADAAICSEVQKGASCISMHLFDLKRSASVRLEPRPSTPR